MRGYVLLSNIYNEFKVTIQTVNTTLKKLKIEKKYKERRAYVKEEDFEKLVKQLELSNRVKKIVELDQEELAVESHKDEIFQLKINHLEDKIQELNKQIEFKDREIESFHSIIRTKEESLDALKEKMLLLTEAKDIELQQKDVQLKDIEANLIQERKQKAIIIEELESYKNRSLGQRILAVFKK